MHHAHKHVRAHNSMPDHVCNTNSQVVLCSRVTDDALLRKHQYNVDYDITYHCYVYMVVMTTTQCGCMQRG